MNGQLSVQTVHHLADSWSFNLFYLSIHSELDEVTESVMSTSVEQSTSIHYDVEPRFPNKISQTFGLLTIIHVTSR